MTWRLCSILTAIEISSLGQQGSKQANIPTALGGDVALFERALTAMSFVLPSQLARYAAWGLAAIKRAEIQTGGGIIPESQIRWLTRPGTVRWPGCMAPLLSPKGEELFRGMQCAEMESQTNIVPSALPVERRKLLTHHVSVDKRDYLAGADDNTTDEEDD